MQRAKLRVHAVHDEAVLVPVHGEHSSAPSAEILPAMQLVAVVEPVAHAAPAGHGMHSDDACRFVLLL